MFSFLKRKSVPNAPERAADVPRKKVSLSQKIKIIVFSVLVALGISAAVAYYVHLKMVVAVQLDQMQKLTDQRASLAADNVRAWQKNKNEELNALIERPIFQAMLEESEEEIQNRLQNFVKNISSAKAMALIRKGAARLSPDSNPPIRYSELSMINAAIKGEEVPVEFARIDGKWQINHVQTVYQGDANEEKEIFGALFTVMGTDELQQSLNRNFQNKARFSLHQKVGNSDSVEVLKIGDGGAGIVANSSIENSWWTIEVEASRALLSETMVQSSFIYSMLAAFGFTLCMLAYLLGRFLGSRLDEKGTTVTKGIAELVTPNKENLVDPIYQKKDILDIEIKDKDAELLGLDDETASPSREQKFQDAPISKEDAAEQASVPDSIFRAYDIRGIVGKELNRELAEKIGQAVGSEALDNNETTIIVARDARTHSPELSEFLIRGILKSGCDVLNIGTVPTPVLYFATETLSESRSGIMVTASHNSADYNGFKVVINGVCRSEDDIKSIRSRILSKNMHEGQGKEIHKKVVAKYIDTIFSDVALAGDIRLVIDSANGVTGAVAPRLFEELGCQVIPLHCDLDGNFPNHDPDPSVPEHLNELIAKVKETRADLGVAFDGDGDRIVVVTGEGKIIWPDRLLMLFAKDIISRNPGSDVIFDVKSTRQLVQSITSYGGRPIMWKTGHAPMKSKMIETGALLGGEFSGHIFIKDRWYGFDDGLYAAARLLEIITLQGESLDEIMQEFPESLITPEIRVSVKEENKFKIIQQLLNDGDFEEAKITHIDGIRAEFPFGWGLVRASNTSPNLTMRFEADDEDSMHKLKSIFVKALRNIDPTIQVNWD